MSTKQGFKIDEVKVMNALGQVDSSYYEISGFYVDDILYSLDYNSDGNVYLEGYDSKKIIGKTSNGFSTVSSNFKCGLNNGKTYQVRNNGNIILSEETYIYGRRKRDCRLSITHKEFKKRNEYKRYRNSVQFFLKIFEDDAEVHIFQNLIIMKEKGTDWFITLDRLNRAPYLVHVTGPTSTPLDTGMIRIHPSVHNPRIYDFDGNYRNFGLPVLNTKYPVAKQRIFFAIGVFNIMLGIRVETNGGYSETISTSHPNMGSEIKGVHGPLGTILPHFRKNVLNLYLISGKPPIGYKNRLLTEHDRIKKIYNEDKKEYLMRLEHLMSVLGVPYTPMFISKTRLEMLLRDPKSLYYDLTNPSKINGVNSRADIDEAIANFDNKEERKIDRGVITIDITPKTIVVNIAFKSGTLKDPSSTVYENINKFLYKDKSWKDIVWTDGKLFKNI